MENRCESVREQKHKWNEKTVWKRSFKTYSKEKKTNGENSRLFFPFYADDTQLYTHNVLQFYIR